MRTVAKIPHLHGLILPPVALLAQAPNTTKNHRVAPIGPINGGMCGTMVWGPPSAMPPTAIHSTPLAVPPLSLCPLFFPPSVHSLSFCCRCCAAHAHLLHRTCSFSLYVFDWMHRGAGEVTNRDTEDAWSHVWMRSVRTLPPPFPPRPHLPRGTKTLRRGYSTIDPYGVSGVCSSPRPYNQTNASFPMAHPHSMQSIHGVVYLHRRQTKVRG